MENDFLNNELAKKERSVESEKEPEGMVDDGTHPEPEPVDFRERYGTLRNQINKAREVFKKQITEVKDAIEKRTEELALFKIKLHKLEGAVEASDLYLKSVLPSNAKK